MFHCCDLKFGFIKNKVIMLLIILLEIGMFRYIIQKKVKLVTYSMIIFIFILAFFGAANIYKSSKIIHNQANLNLIFLTKNIKSNVNKYFEVAAEQTENCRKTIELTIDRPKLYRFAPIASKYEEHKIPYFQNYIDLILSPLLLYIAKETNGVMSIFFNFDFNLVPHEKLIGTWYVKSMNNNSFELVDNGFVSTMFPENRSDLEWFYQPKIKKKGVWSKPYVDEDLKINMITYSAPVYLSEEFLGVVGVDISMEEMRLFLDKFEIYKTGKTYLIDKDNTIIFAHDYNSHDSTELIDPALYKYLEGFLRNNDAINNKNIVVFKSKKNKTYTLARLHNDFVLVVEVPNEELYGEINRLVVFTSLSLILAILIALLIAIEAYAKVKNINNELIHKEKLMSMGAMAAEVAHELNNPIGYISCNIDTLKKFFVKIKEVIFLFDLAFKNIIEKQCSVEEELENIIKVKEETKLDFVIESVDEILAESTEGVNRVSSIVLNLKNFSKDDSQDSENLEYLDKLVEESIKILKNKIPSDIQIVTNYGKMTPVCCRKNQIRQVLLNLVDNAIQSFDGKSIDNKKITINTYKKGQYACIEIEDNGVGIEKSKKSKIFDAFFTTKSMEKGTGLGLSVVYEIITNKHNGEIFVESKKGNGTKFTIKLPCSKCYG